MFSASSNRVPEHTAPEVQQTLQEQTEANIQYFASRGKEIIEKRIEDLDREWDVERTLEANAATIALTGVILGTMNKKWLLLPALVTGFLLQHAIQGWCPPLPLLRRLGFRTRAEIDEEKYALKALRGDFEKLSVSNIADKAGLWRALESVRH